MAADFLQLGDYILLDDSKELLGVPKCDFYWSSTTSYMWRLHGCTHPGPMRHVMVRKPKHLVRAYQDKNFCYEGQGLNCLACRACYSTTARDLFLGSRPPSTPELRLYDTIQAVFGAEVMSLEHYFPRHKKSVDVMLITRNIAFQADGYDHKEIQDADMAFDQGLFQQGISVVRLYCRDSGWNGVVQHAKELSDAGKAFILYSPEYHTEAP